MEFGAFVNFMGAKDGLVHISELADQRVAQTIRCRIRRRGSESHGRSGYG
jgi:predicted RNA-binding protein with RPS1 domain